MCHFEFWYSLDLNPAVGLPDHMVPLCLVFLRNLHVIFQSSHTRSYSSPEKRRISLSLCPLQDLFFVDLFDAGQCDQCELILHGTFGLHWFNSEWGTVFFQMLLEITHHEYHLPLETDLLESLFWIFFQWFTLGHYLRASVIDSLEGFRVIRVHQHWFLSFWYRKWPQGSSISSCPILFPWASRV